MHPPLIDIHCHILPGLDDGPASLATSTAMAEVAAGDTIGVVIATPHTDGIRVHRDTVRPKVRELNRELNRLAISLEILAGYEIPSHLAVELAADHPLAGSSYVLIEFPHTYLPQDALTTIYRLQDQGLYPIIAHPERNGDVLTQPDRLLPLIEAGALAQLTAASITGELGADLQRCAHYLLKKDMIQFIATDSHSPSFRRPVLQQAYAVTAKLLGRQKADLLIRTNPGRIIAPGHP